MKKALLSLLCIIIITSVSAFAQLRGDVSTPFDYQGPIINSQTATIQSKLGQLFSNINMSHSYSMSVSSFAGSYQSVNAYTNTMQVNLTDRLDARVDLSFLHSPFGGSSLYGANLNNPRIVLSNAELNYKISENALIQVRFQQLPASYGYGYGYDRFNNPWYR